jgi:hypothetical protein
MIFEGKLGAPDAAKSEDDWYCQNASKRNKNHRKVTAIHRATNSSHLQDTHIITKAIVVIPHHSVVINIIPIVAHNRKRFHNFIAYLLIYRYDIF